MQYSSSYKENKGVKERIIENIRALLEWLNFVGCKIPVIIYCESNFGFLQKIQVSTTYKLLSFTDNLNSIEKFINEEFEEDDNKKNDFQIVNVNNFTLYKVNYIIVKKNQKHKGDDDEDSENDSGDEEKKLLDHEQSFVKKGHSKLRLNINDNEEGDEEDNKVNSKNEDSSLIYNSSNSNSSSKKSSSKK